MDHEILTPLAHHIFFLTIGVPGLIGVLGAALALGMRHGIDWDHIAAITDITSTAASLDEAESGWLVREPALMLTDESHHSLAAVGATPALRAAVDIGAAGSHSHSIGELAHRHNGHSPTNRLAIDTFVRKQKPALVLGSMYALGHGSIVVVLGLLALLARQFLPDWIDPIMERLVGVTLIFLAVYLFYSVIQYFRGGQEFRLRSRWMLVFAGVRNAVGLARAKIVGRPHQHTHEAQQYGVRTAYAVGLIHGVGAETGTQVLVIATAVGAGSRAMGVAALGAFVVGLLISNSIVTIISTAGFVSSQRRQWVYVAAGLLAAVFSLFVGLFFLLHRTDILPDLDVYFRRIGGPK
jgi:high-affinity nickel-transport protein